MGSVSRQIGKRVKSVFFNLYKPQVTRNMELRSEDVIRDGRGNDYPDFLIQTVSNSPYGIAAMRKLQSFIKGRGINHEELAETPVNAEETFDDLHRKIANDLAFSGRFAVKIIPNARGEIVELYHVPFEAVRYAIPDNNGRVDYVGVNYKWNTDDYRQSDTKHYPLFNPRIGFGNLRDEIARYQHRYKDEEYKGHIFFYCETSEKNRTYSRPAYFAAQDWFKVDGKVGVFHNRNTDNNFFLGGVISVVGDPTQGIFDEAGKQYTTVGEEFERQLADTFSGADRAGRFLLDWIDSPDQATKVSPWPGASNHELFTVLEAICQERIAVSTGIPKILMGVPTAGKLGDNQEIRNAIKFVNENTENTRRILQQFYNQITELMNGVTVPEDGVKIEKIRDFTDLPESIIGYMTQAQREQYLLEQFGIEPDEEAEMEVEEENQLTETDDTADIEE